MRFILSCIFFLTSIAQAQLIDTRILIERWNQDAKSKSNLESVFYIGSFTPKNKLSPQIPTHILVVGTAGKVESDQYFQSAILQAKVYQERFPDHQVLIVSNPDVINRTNKQVFDFYKLEIIATEKSRLNTHHLVKLMKKFKTIWSFDYFGHSSPWSLNLSGGQQRLDLRSQQQRLLLATLQGHFIASSFGTLNSCNSGFYLAPYLSRLWKTSLSGSLTGSVFERLHQDRLWYKKRDQDRTSFSSFNSVSLTQTESCLAGVCWRMMPDRSNYSSYWGSFNAGLSFNKTFCHEGEKTPNCLQAMALRMVTFPSSRKMSITPSKEDYQNTIFDWLCSTKQDPRAFIECQTNIELASESQNLFYNPHPGQTLQCDLKGCDATIRCDHDPNTNQAREGSCSLRGARERTTTLIDEFELLIAAYRYL